MLTEETLKNSDTYKNWITGLVMLIHNTYWDSTEPYAAYIVIWIPKDGMGKFSITRFFEMGRKIHASADYGNLSAKEVFEVLLKNYSRGLK